MKGREPRLRTDWQSLLLAYGRVRLLVSIAFCSPSQTGLTRCRRDFRRPSASEEIGFQVARGRCPWFYIEKCLTWPNRSMTRPTARCHGMGVGGTGLGCAQDGI